MDLLGDVREKLSVALVASWWRAHFAKLSAWGVLSAKGGAGGAPPRGIAVVEPVGDCVSWQREPTVLGEFE